MSTEFYLADMQRKASKDSLTSEIRKVLDSDLLYLNDNRQGIFSRWAKGDHVSAVLKSNQNELSNIADDLGVTYDSAEISHISTIITGIGKIPITQTYTLDSELEAQFRALSVDAKREHIFFNSNVGDLQTTRDWTGKEYKQTDFSVYIVGSPETTLQMKDHIMKLHKHFPIMKQDMDEKNFALTRKGYQSLAADQRKYTLRQ